MWRVNASVAGCSVVMVVQCGKALMEGGEEERGGVVSRQFFLLALKNISAHKGKSEISVFISKAKVNT
jgi:hypothetical protein